MRARRYGAGVYLCGYAVELALKSRICKTLRWRGYPGTHPEFRGYQSFRTHDLHVLLRLSGLEVKIRTVLQEAWANVSGWSAEMRYNAVGTATQEESTAMIESTRKLLRAL